MMASYSGVASAGLAAPSHTTLADLFKHYRYESTIGLLFLYGKKADIADVNVALQKIDVELVDVKGVQRDTEKWWSRLLIKFDDHAKSELERVKDLDGQIISLRNENVLGNYLNKARSGKCFIKQLRHLDIILFKEVST